MLSIASNTTRITENTFVIPNNVKQNVSKWKQEDLTSCLSREFNTNRFIFTDGRTNRPTSFKSTLYDTNYAVTLIKMFHQTIGINLTKESLNATCFLPKLSLQAYQAPEIQVALFGHVDTRVNPAGEVKWLRWGVFNTDTKVEQTLDIEENDLAKLFIYHAPTTNRAHLEQELDENGSPLLDSKGKPCLKPASDHYAMTNYTKRFRVVVSRDADKCIEKVILQRISLLDKQVVLDDDNWAVTLVSGKYSSQNSLNRFFCKNTGHAMIACEGVKKGQSFLHYVHLTQDPHDKNPLLKSDEAQIESFSRDFPLNTINGPTWTRSKNLVKNMLSYVDSMKKEKLKFAPYGKFSLNFPIFLFYLRNSIPTQDSLINLQEKDLPTNCLQCTYNLLIRCGIIFQLDQSLKKPIEKIKQIKSSVPIFYIPEDFNCESLGIPITDPTIVKNILFSCVILTPNNYSPSDCLKWANQIMMEENYAVAKELERISSVKFLEIFGGYQPKRW